MIGTSLLKRFAADKKGTTAIIFALTSIPVIGIVGLAIDFARAASVNSRLQAALDSAVMAAAEVETGNQAAMAQRYFEANFRGGGAVRAGTVRTEFSVNGSGHFSGTASADINTSIMQILNFDTMSVAAVAEAKPNAETTTTETTTITETVTVRGSTPCIHVMDQSGARTLKLMNNYNLDARNCEIHVRTNSNDAIYTENEDTVKWKRLLVKGAAGTTWGLLDTIMAAPNRIQYNQQVVGDPYTRSVDDVSQTISAGNCNNANTNKSYANTTVSPGTYCGSTTFSGVTFQTGVYIIKSKAGDDGRLHLSGVLNGSAGVSFFFADNKAQIGTYTATAGTVLNAPTTGNTRGLLFFENSNRGGNWSLTAADMTNHRWNGVVYLPSANLTLQKWSSTTSMAWALIVNRLTASEWTGVTNTYAWTPFNATSPITLPDTTTSSTRTQEITTTTTRDGWLFR